MTSPSRQSDVSVRDGFTLMEVIVAAGLVGALFVVTIPLLSQVRVVRQEAQRRMIAGLEAANVMEAVAALAQRDGLNRDALDNLVLTSAANRLPEGSLEVELADAELPFNGQRVTVRVSWTTDVGRIATPVSLTAWFPTEGGE